MSLEFGHQLQPFEASFLEELSSLSEVVFGESIEDLCWRLEAMPGASVFCAKSGSQLVGFKAGYAMSQVKYYSWLGGVHPQFRRSGIASKLMSLQHTWLTQHGYRLIETATNQENLAMCQVNLKQGLSVCGLRNEPHRVQVLFSKVLA